MKYDVERYITGGDEVSRKRKVITRILTTLITLLTRHWLPMSLKHDAISVVIAKPDGFVKEWGLAFTPHIKEGEGGSVGVLYWSDDSVIREWSKDADTLSFGAVPKVYDALPRIIKAVDDAIGDGIVVAHFEFFQNQAPATQAEN